MNLSAKAYYHVYLLNVSQVQVHFFVKRGFCWSFFLSSNV